MEAEFGRTDMITQAVPNAVIVLLAVLGLAGWLGMHIWRRRTQDRWTSGMLALVSMAEGTLATWLTLQSFARWLLLATPWPLWLCAAMGGMGVEAILLLYKREQSVMGSLVARVVPGLRVLALLLLLFMLVQPVLTLTLSRRFERTVVVLVDDSQSMHIADLTPTIEEKLAVASLYELDSVKNRLNLEDPRREMGTLSRHLAAELSALDVPTGGSEEGVRALLRARAPSLAPLLEDDIAPLLKALTARTAERLPNIADDSPAHGAWDAAHATLTEKAMPALAESLKMIEPTDKRAPAERLTALIKELQLLVKTLDTVAVQFAVAETEAGQSLYDRLNDDERQALDANVQKPRAEIAQHLLQAPRGDELSLLEGLRKQYGVKLFRFASRTEPLDPTTWMRPLDVSTNAATNTTEEGGAFRQSTDMVAALEETLQDISSENLAGVLLVSDGRHNGSSGLEAVARRYGAQGAPIHTVPVGTVNPPRDAAIVGLRAPESIYLNDKVSLRVDLKLDGLRGQKVNISLINGGAAIETKTVDVPEDRYRTSLRFSHTPEVRGIERYRVVIEALEEERFAGNNEWPFDVAVSDDRTNVLLVDTRPRWEYRYLRNLFYGRDKSVHLQYVLTQPDTMAESEPAPFVYASAGRKFGDAEASALPETREEWLKFDAIILGDVGPGDLSEDDILEIRHCVEERGSLLVIIAGPHDMPHRHDSEILREMLPMTYTPTPDTLYAAPDSAAQIVLTPDGRNHVIMQQSSGASENLQIWAAMPSIWWRHPGLEAKPGATVLAYAQSVTDASTPSSVDQADLSLESATEQLERLASLRQRHALLTEQRYGRGRVLMLSFDETWRFRYRVGDTYHHRFWGQVLRWGTGENLRAGTDQVRLGTDMLTYTPDDPIQVLAKLIESDSNPVNGAKVFAYISRNNQLVVRKRLPYREASNGIYEAFLSPFKQPGSYRVVLESPTADKLLAGTGETEVATEFTVLATKTPVELAELSIDSDLLQHMAELSGGAMTSVDDAHLLATAFGPGSKTVTERKERTLWDSWPLLVLLLLCITAEWILRRKAGLP